MWSKEYGEKEGGEKTIPQRIIIANIFGELILPQLSAW